MYIPVVDPLNSWKSAVDKTWSMELSSPRYRDRDESVANLRFVPKKDQIDLFSVDRRGL